MSLHKTLATSHPSIERGQAWCRHCGSTQKANPSYCMQYGWPKCCGYTMTIDSPEEQHQLAAQKQAAA